MKNLLALLLLTVAFQAQAAPKCVPIFKRPIADFTPRIVEGTTGTHFYWWCKAADGITYNSGFSCMKGSCSPFDWGTISRAVNASTDLVADVDKAWADSIKFDCYDVYKEATPRGAMCTERFAILDKNAPEWLKGLVQPDKPIPPPPPPPPPTHKVKANGAYLTRPTFTLANGVLGKVPTGFRAAVGTPCDMTKPTYPSTLGNVWAEYDPVHPGLVALCAPVAAP